MNHSSENISKTCENISKTCRQVRHALTYSTILILILSKSLYAQDNTSKVDKLFNWVKPGSPGCLCAISQNRKIVMNKAYGVADLEKKLPLTTASLLDAGSVRKQFVAAAVLLLAKDGKLSLTDDVRKYIPQLPDYGHKITIDHLLTHTSGIRDWQPLLNIAAGDPEAMTMILRQRGLNFVPGEEWSYSNSGYVLLTEIVAKVSAMPFPEFAKKRLFDPLGMKSTTYAMDMKQAIANRALGYRKTGDSWTINMYMGNDRGGAGALFTNPADLLTWNAALTDKKLGEFVSKKLEEPARLNNGRTLFYTRGLSVEPYRGQPRVSHSGGAGGYNTWLGRLHDQQLSIAVMCNSDAVPASAIASQIQAMYVPAGALVNSEDGPPPPIPADLLDDVNGKAGLYFSKEAGMPLRLAIDRGRFRIVGGPGLLTLSKDRFQRWGAFDEFMSKDKFELKFISPNEFELKSMEGKISRYIKARPFNPTNETMETFKGRYQSEELMATIDVTVIAGSLVGQLNNLPGKTFPLVAVHTDTFQVSGIMLQFVRDNSGKITGLDYSNPLLRKVPFKRM